MAQAPSRQGYGQAKIFLNKTSRTPTINEKIHFTMLKLRMAVQQKCLRDSRKISYKLEENFCNMHEGLKSTYIKNSYKSIIKHQNPTEKLAKDMNKYFTGNIHANKLMKRCSMSGLRDIEIKTPKTPFYTHSMGKNKKVCLYQVLARMGSNWKSHTLLLAESKLVQPPQKTIWQYL